MLIDIKSNDFLLNILPKIILWLGKNQEAKEFQTEKFHEYGGNDFHEIKNILAMFYGQANKDGSFEIKGYENHILLKVRGYKCQIFINEELAFDTNNAIVKI